MHWSLALMPIITFIAIAFFSVNSWISLARMELAILGLSSFRSSMYLVLKSVIKNDLVPTDDELKYRFLPTSSTIQSLEVWSSLQLWINWRHALTDSQTPPTVWFHLLQLHHLYAGEVVCFEKRLLWVFLQYQLVLAVARTFFVSISIIGAAPDGHCYLYCWHFISTCGL